MSPLAAAGLLLSEGQESRGGKPRQEEDVKKQNDAASLKKRE
jgi:hypothetical protein